MKIRISVLSLLCPLFLIAQNTQFTTIAKQGDGIFSLLREHGLDPGKYYGEFVTLNKENLKNGSELHLGRKYIIPNAEDSFKNRAVTLRVDKDKEESLFTSDLESISPKSTKLKNAVIYLISGSSLLEKPSSNSKISDAITINLAQELMEHGAQVYLIKSKEDNKVIAAKENATTEPAMAQLSQMQEYVNLINKKYLIHHGKYQRLLITRVSDNITDDYCKISVYHHNSSENGKRIATNIKRVFNENSIKNTPFKEYTEIFTDKNNLYLAKNTLPAITLIEIGDGKNKKPAVEDFILVDSSQELLSNLITNGVLNDYVDVKIEK